MSRKKPIPKYLIIYKCQHCGEDCGYTENEKPRCRFCNKADRLVVLSRQKITPEVMAARLKAVSDRMMSHLESAYEQVPRHEDNIVAEGKDAENDLLKLMALAKNLRDKLHNLQLKKPDDTGP